MPHTTPHSVRLALCEMSRARMLYVPILSWWVCIMLLHDMVALNYGSVSPVKNQNRVKTLTKEVPGVERQDP